MKYLVFAGKLVGGGLGAAFVLLFFVLGALLWAYVTLAVYDVVYLIGG